MEEQKNIFQLEGESPNRGLKGSGFSTIQKVL